MLKYFYRNRHIIEIFYISRMTSFLYTNAQNEILKMLEAISGTANVQVQELDEEENESEEIKNKKRITW